MDIVTRNITLKKDIITALEWSINEITDNVLNHSNASEGGIIQISSYPQNRRISFAVADSGMGIKASLHLDFYLYDLRGCSTKGIDNHYGNVY